MTPKTYPATVDSAEHVADTGPSFLAKSKKAVAGGIAAAVAAGGTALGTAATDGNVTQADLWIVAVAVVGGFLTGVLAVWNAPANES